MPESGIACPNCGNEMGDLAHFCNKCGTKLPPPSEPVDTAERDEIAGICGEAGHFAQSEVIKARFCIICGKRLPFVGEG